MSKPVSNKNKRIVKNSFYLYFKQAIIVVIALYSSRLLLNKLGIDNYGLYGLVASITSMFAALKGLFSTTIQRFINIEQASGDTTTINTIFNTGVIIQFVIAIIFFIVVEGAGLIMIPKLNITDSQMSTAFWVLQFSIISTILTILTVPYDAILIAKEQFMVFSIISILEASLKLIIIYLISFSPFNILIFYTFLLVIVALIVRMISSFYCKCHYKDETKIKIQLDKPLLKKMSSFAGWQFLGNMGYAITNSGTNIILNLFGGVVANAARMIAYQIMSVMEQALGNLNSSFQPQTMMEYAKHNQTRLVNLTIINSKAQFFVCFIISCIMILFTPQILQIWLGETPVYTVVFIRALFCYIIIRSLHAPIDTLFKASGLMKRYQIWEIAVMMLNLPFGYIALRIGMPYYSLFIVMAIVEVFSFINILRLLKIELDFPISALVKNIYSRVVIAVVIFLLLYITMEDFIDIALYRYNLYLIMMATVIIITLGFTPILFTKKEITNFIKLIKP